MIKKTQIYLVVVLFVADFTVKQMILNIDSLQNKVLIKNFFELRYTQNFGISFSMLSDNRFLIISFSIVALMYIYKLITVNQNKLNYLLPLLIIMAGALGNLFDRIFYGFVVDYLSFSVGGYDFAIFNLADTMIVCSAIYLVTYAWFIEKE